MGAESYRETRENLVERKQLLREITVQPSVQHYTFKITQWLPPQSTEQRLLTRQDHELQARYVLIWHYYLYLQVDMFLCVQVSTAIHIIQTLDQTYCRSLKLARILPFAAEW